LHPLRILLSCSCLLQQSHDGHRRNSLPSAQGARRMRERSRMGPDEEVGPRAERYDTKAVADPAKMLDGARLNYAVVEPG
jgi:hypothetical protein